MSELKVNKLTGITGTSAGAPITLSGDTATLGTGVTIGSGVTFPAGTVLQVVGVMDSAIDYTTGLIPTDDTIPQNTEGKEAFTLAITPSNANNKLLIHAFCGAISNATDNRRCVLALFQDSVVNALAASLADYQPIGTGEQSLDLTHFMTAGTTGEIIFRLRFGSNLSGTTTLNGSSTTYRIFGGVIATGMTITEIANVS
jgi:hypothetical protein